MRRFIQMCGVGVVLAIALAALAASAGGAAAQDASIFGPNLVVNGDAEAGPGNPNAGDAAIAPPGWTVNGPFTVAQYGGSGGLPATTDPGPVHRGRNFFAGGNSNAESSARQLIDVGAGAAEIDTGAVKYKLYGYLGGYENQGDHAIVSARFEDANGRTLGSTSIGPVTPADRKNVTGLLLRGTSGAVPARTRKVEVVITATRSDGAYNDGYSDSIWLSLAK